ncbi:MAG TPA: hypothetical protein VMZ26_13680 [Pyrinomonadaceae bacterium]|nr:hypothetical protein [Pyrinomonadaceae bacterium]
MDTGNSNNMNNKVKDGEQEHGLADNISGLGQKIIGTIENVGGVLTGDPMTRAEGEFNAEVGDVREDLEVSQERREGHDDAETPSEENEG